MATAKQLPSGSWRCQVYAGTAPDGKRQYRSFTAYTKKEAEYAALEWQLHYREISRDSSNMTLAEAMERYLASKDSILSPSTVRGYDIIRRRHLQAHANPPKSIDTIYDPGSIQYREQALY